MAGTATTTQFLVGMADIHVCRGPALFTCLGLGSCIGLAALDPTADVAGMIHIMLPEAFPDKPVEKPGKFADTGIREWMRLLEKAGAQPGRLRIAYAGGAQVFKFGANADSRLDVGARNSAAVADHLKRMGLKVLATDVGGNSGRTVTLDSATGAMKVRTVSTGDRDLINLRK